MSRFDGDGRVSLAPLPGDAPEGTRPMKVRRSICRTLAKQFDERGVSYHSSAGAVVWVIVEHCRTNHIPYKLGGYGGELGWVVERVPDA